MPQLITIRAFDNYITAYAVKALLEDHGVTCFLKDEHVALVFGSAVTGFQLQVPEVEQSLAEQVLSDHARQIEAERAQPGFLDEDTGQLDPANRICVHCGSRNTRRVEDKKDSPLLTWLFSKFNVAMESKVWYCFHCGEYF